MSNKYTALCLVLSVLFSTAISAEESIKRYVTPDDVQCSLKAPQNIMFCTDNDGTPLTGEMVKYFEGTIIRLYTLKEGILDGTGYVYYADGTPKSEIPYVRGQVNGVMKKYDRMGKLSEEIPYQNNKKEGIAKYYDEKGSLISQIVYLEDKPNGDMYIYDSALETPIYRLKNLSGQFISGTYTYQIADNKLKTVQIPDIIITAFNKKCLDFQSSLSTSPCAAFYSQNSECDQAWRKANRQAVRSYLKTCGETNE